MAKDTTNGRKNRVIGGLLVLLLVYLLHLFLKTNFDIAIPCIFHEITGWYCSGCGITRSIESLVTFNLYQAFRYNMLVVVLIPFFLICVINSLYCYVIDRKNTIYSRVPVNLLIVLVVITLIFGILRNIEPFDFLAPIDIN